MSRDYKQTGRNAGGRGGGGSLLIGILIGLVLGLAIALAVAWYINRMPTPFLDRTPPAAKAETPKGPSTSGEGSAKAQDGKPRFDFYRILPGAEEQVTEQQFRDAQQKPSTAQAKEAFFLQAGAFQNGADADNLKAQLALLGMEAAIQTTTLPDKGMWHRVRLGPYTAIDELNRAREILKQNGIETSLIRVRETPAQAAK